MYLDEELVPISAMQHFVFCRRQCALIHLEEAWAENRLTAEGRLLHDRVDQASSESRREMNKYLVHQFSFNELCPTINKFFTVARLVLFCYPHPVCWEHCVPFRGLKHELLGMFAWQRPFSDGRCLLRSLALSVGATPQDAAEPD